MKSGTCARSAKRENPPKIADGNAGGNILQISRGPTREESECVAVSRAAGRADVLAA
jgi:hypothetical protein